MTELGCLSALVILFMFICVFVVQVTFLYLVWNVLLIGWLGFGLPFMPKLVAALIVLVLNMLF